jgi:uncharacterized tellurite resistance protein B-like protein
MPPKRYPQTDASVAVESKLIASHKQQASVETTDPTPLVRSLATVLFAQSASDGTITGAELAHITNVIETNFQLSEGEATLILQEALQAAAVTKDDTILNSLNYLRKKLSREQKYKLLGYLAEIAQSDNELSPHEISFLHSVKESLSLR